jgi:hypothetical protein
LSADQLMRLLLKLRAFRPQRPATPFHPGPGRAPYRSSPTKPHHPDPASTRLLPILTRAPIRNGKAIPESSKRDQLTSQLLYAVKGFARDSFVNRHDWMSSIVCIRWLPHHTRRLVLSWFALQRGPSATGTPCKCFELIIGFGYRWLAPERGKVTSRTRLGSFR